jgi:hypothetical protein
MHRQVINEKNITGRMLMNNKLRQMLCLSKGGDLIPVEIGVRINNELFSGVQYVGVLNFPIRKMDSCVLLTTKKGKIQGMTTSARQFFQKGQEIFTYNPSFKRIYQDMNYVSKEKLIKRDKGKDYNMLMKNPKRMKYW